MTSSCYNKDNDPEEEFRFHRTDVLFYKCEKLVLKCPQQKMFKNYKVILFINPSRGYGRKLLRGIGKYSKLYGPWTFYKNPPYYRDSAKPERVLSRLKEWGADGAILHDFENSNEIIRMGLPTIIGNFKERIAGCPTIMGDNAALAKMAFTYFFERGFCHFAFCGYEHMFWSQDRVKFFSEVLHEAGLECHLYTAPKSKIRRYWENEQEFLANWLKSIPKPVAVMVCNDDRGQEVIDACNLAGFPVPEEVAVLGVDNDVMVCELCNPPLSSIARNTENAGFQSAMLLNKMMAGQKVQQQDVIIRPTYVVTRQSTDTTAIKDREVAGSVKFIREHGKHIIQVNDVVKTVPLSRRVLEKRFRREVGRSIHDEIIRVRIEHVAKMLIDTNMTLSQIALELGYPDVKHISRSFKKVKEICAQSYRKKYAKNM